MTSPENMTPVFPTINIGSYTSSPIGSPIFTFQDTSPSRPNTIEHPQYTSSHDHQRDHHDNQVTTENTNTVEADDGEEVVGEKKSFLTDLKARQWLTLIILLSGNISAAMFYSLLAPFFPTEAKKKGATLYEVGIIFGTYQLIQFITSPIFGYYLTQIGSKFLFVAGNFVCSGCAILFGILQWCPNGVTYVLMCFVVRSVESVGGAAQNTAGFAIAAYTFPNHINIVMGLFQAGSCIGLMAGPPIGGLLFYKGGFYLPFAVTGSLFMFFSVLSFFFLPSPQKQIVKPSGTTQSRLKLLKIPIVPIIGFIVFVGQATIGFTDVALAAFLTEIDSTMTAVSVGLIFLIPAGLVVLTAPIFGLMTDKYKFLGRPLLIFGCLAAAVGFLGVGPCPLLSFLPSNKIWMVITSLAVSALGWGALVLTYQQYITAAKDNGFPDGLETQGIISGINGAFNSLGALLGPTIGGVLYEQLKFPWASTIFAGLVLSAGMTLLLYVLFEKTCTSHQQNPPDESDTTSQDNSDTEQLLHTQHS